MLEDPNRRYYNEGELKEFDGIESEWPLFYVMMIIDGVFRTLPDQVEEYQKLLKARIYMDEYGGKYRTIGCIILIIFFCLRYL